MQPTPIHQIASLLGLSCKSTTLLTSASVDSRNTSKGDLFFALPGERSDGHNFLEAAAKKGALSACVHEGYKGPDYGMILLFVPNVLEALQKIAQELVKRARYKVVAITGSIGKTTTKEFTKTLLEGSCKLFASPLSYNTRITVPLTILLAEGDEDILLLEMGMSKPGQIAKLVSIVPPDLALITTISLQHARYFPEGLKAIAKEKAMIFSHEKTKVGLYHKEMPYHEIAESVGSCTKISFSPSAITSPFSNKALHHNFCAALRIVYSLGVPHEIIEKNIPKLTPPKGRFERVERGGIHFINDAYNANPEAIFAALEALPKVKGKKIGVLSEMNDLGHFAKKAHREVGKAAYAHLDHLLCIGAECTVMRPFWKEKPFEYFSDKKSLSDRLQKLATEGDLVLLKGARAYALDELLLCF